MARSLPDGARAKAPASVAPTAAGLNPLVVAGGLAAVAVIAIVALFK